MSDPLPQLPPRPAGGHKGTFGAVAVVGGCARKPSDDDPAPASMVGGPALSAIAALRAGAGLARLLVPEPLVPAALTIAPSATGVPLPVNHADHDLNPAGAAAALDEAMGASACVVAGPGLGVSPGARAVTLRLVGQNAVPLVLDADALNALASLEDVGPDVRAPAVLTPHPGEFARLARSLGLDADAVADPSAAAGALARRLGVVVVLKGAQTALSDGVRDWVHDRPNPAMGTAGTGDVLCGLLGGLIAQHVRVTPVGPRGMDLYDAARLAVAIHADAGARWAADTGCRGGMLAAELADRLPPAVEARRGSE